MKSFFARYQQDDCEQVWQELTTLGPAVRSPEVYPDAQAVAIETMRRVRVNIERLLPRLEELGYEFGYAWMKESPIADEAWIAMQPARFTPPSSEIAQLLQQFEQEAGLLPLSLWAFYHEVGGINLVGRHLAWEQLFRRQRTATMHPTNLDPLVVWSLELIVEEHASSREEHPYHLPIAADDLLKYNVSGAGPYWIEVPDAAADALVRDEWHQTTFVNYLRICLRYGGLPGLEFISHLIPEELAYLRKDLLPM